MEAVVFVEVLDKRGGVAQRTRVDRLPATIGRSYGNDVILDDPFVSPEHARIEHDPDGNLILADLGSANGTYQTRPLQRIPRAAVVADCQFRLGQTVLRIRDAQHPVPAALPQRGLAATARVLERPFVCAGTFVLVLALLGLDAYLGSYERVAPGPIVTRLAGLTTLLVIWSGAWALTARVLSHRFHMAQHCAVAALAMLACFTYDHALDYYAFAFAADRSVEVLTWAGAFGLPAAVLYAHLRLSSTAPGRRLGLGAILASGTLVGLAALFVAGVQASPSLYYWTSHPQYPGQLKLPSLRVAHSRQVEDFFSRTRDLKARVDAAGHDG